MSAYLAHIVEGEPEEESVGDGLDNAEESVNNPVGEPLCVILLGSALNGLYTGNKRSFLIWNAQSKTKQLMDRKKK